MRYMRAITAPLFLVSAVIGFGARVVAQSSAVGELKNLNAVTTAVPFLRIGPDARSGSMGDVGIGITPDPNGWYYNPAKMAFAVNDMGLSITYTPWLKALVQDIYLASAYGYKRIDPMQTIGASLRYFSLGVLQFTTDSGEHIGDYSPNEFALDAGYARKLTDMLSTGIMLRFIYSDLASGYFVDQVKVKPGMTAAADFSLYYEQKDLTLGEYKAQIGAGLNISNIGAKITYTSDAVNKDFIPTNLGIGSALNIIIDEYNEFMIGLEFNKLLVPTPDTIAIEEWKGVPVVRGMMNSFSDAPGGMREELNEIMYSIGAEYWYDRQFAVRAGYFNEHTTKGNRKFFTVGVGVKYNIFGLNFAYLVPASGQNNPLDNTLRFSLLFDFEALKKKDKAG